MDRLSLHGSVPAVPRVPERDLTCGNAPGSSGTSQGQGVPAVPRRDPYGGGKGAEGASRVF